MLDIQERKRIASEYIKINGSDELMTDAEDTKILCDLIEGCITALQICSKECDIFYQKMSQTSHIQTILDDDHSIWYARDVSDEMIKKIKEKIKL